MGFAKTCCLSSLQKAALKGFAVVPKNINDFTDFALGDSRHFGGLKVYSLAEHIFAAKGKDLEEVIKEIDSQLIPHMYEFSHTVNISAMRQMNIKDPDSERNFKAEIIKKALEQDIPVAPSQYAWLTAKKPWFTKQFLNLRELDDVSAARECLKWVNCVIECCCSEPLFKKEQDQENNISRIYLKTEDKLNTPAELEKQKQDEDLIRKLWEKGYLKCDLSR